MKDSRLCRLLNSKEALIDDIQRHHRYSLGKQWEERNNRDIYAAFCLSLRDRIMDLLLETEGRYRKAQAKRLYYLSMEFLIGSSARSNLINLGLMEVAREVFSGLEINPDDIWECESDAALGNGGLGRLAACFLDSLATLGMPGFGYGLQYEFGLFRQTVEDGYQREKPDNWLADGSPWLLERRDQACLVPIYGRVVPGQDLNGGYNPMWLDWDVIVGVPSDMPIVGFGGHTVNYLRLFAAYPSSEFDLEIFNLGDYLQAVSQKIDTERISKILYPSDAVEVNRELRLVQEYFLVACTLRDIVRRHAKPLDVIEHLPKQVAIHLNDTHPALMVAELMRLLVDEYSQGWEQAWQTCTDTLAYTNHTLMSEALEKWPVALLIKVVPRHLEIIHEINRRFLQQVAAMCPGDDTARDKCSLIEEGPEPSVRMGHLAVVGSHSTNGVSALHSELVKQKLFPEFYRLWPRRFNNKTNGITVRRWLLLANPQLAGLISEAIGEAWITDARELCKLEPLAEDPGFREAFAEIKRGNKRRLASLISQTAGMKVDPLSLFDVQAKRIHEYKRQLLNLLQVMAQYLGIVEDGLQLPQAKTYVFAGKAAPGYWAAKQIIKLVHCVGTVVNQDRRTGGLLKVVFIPDYRVSLAEMIIPAAEISEQISTAGTEASGTGNMKFALNGALTIGTLDGANVEMMEEFGAENIYIFGLKADEVEMWQKQGAYNPRDIYQQDPKLARVLDGLRDGRFSPAEPDLFHWLFNHLLAHGETYFHLADFHSYRQAQERALQDYSDVVAWNRKAILNVARSGKFSSDRSIAEYAGDIWGIESGHH